VYFGRPRVYRDRKLSRLSRFFVRPSFAARVSVPHDRFPRAQRQSTQPLVPNFG
jgi:hypothetical protein